MVLDAAFLNTRQFKVRIKFKLDQSRGKKSRPILYLVVVVIEKGVFESSLTKFKNVFYLLYIYIYIYIYIAITRPTVSLYHNSSVWLDT